MTVETVSRTISNLRGQPAQKLLPYTAVRLFARGWPKCLALTLRGATLSKPQQLK